MQDRRSQSRAALSLKVRVDGPKGRQHLTARDLSSCGAFVETARPYPAGQMLEIRLTLSREARIELTAQVRHQANGYRTADGGGPYRGMGLRFVRIDAEAQQVLNRFLSAALG